MTTSFSPFHVLVVDDNESIHHDVRTLLGSTFEPNDLDELSAELLGIEPVPRVEIPAYRLDSAYQGKDAVHAVRHAVAAGRAYALAFVDIRMPPGWDGVKTIQRMREIDSDMQIAICSAYSDYAWAEIVNQLGASDKLFFLRKPFDPYAIRQLALSLTLRWQREHELRALLRTHEHRLERYEAGLRELREHLAVFGCELHIP